MSAINLQNVVETKKEDTNDATEVISDGDDDDANEDETLVEDIKTLSSSSQQNILNIVRQSLIPFSDRLDPFAALPVTLDRFQEHLVSFYLLYYPKVTYGFSPRLQPHPVATNFSIALTTPACFQVALARSALYRISLSKFSTPSEERALEMAVMRHKGEALKLVRGLSTASNPKRKDDLLASIISLGTLDRRTGASSSAGMHYAAVRRILKVTGGPLAVRSLLLSRVMVFFECIYGTSPESYVWDQSDLPRLLKDLNQFLDRISRLQKSSSDINALREDSNASDKLHTLCLKPGSTLLSIVSKQPKDPSDIKHPQRLELICQLTCLLTLAAIMLDHSNSYETLRTYMNNLHKMIDDLKLAEFSSNNVMWQIQINDHSDKHSRRIWRAASYAWVMKHTTYNVQNMMKDWLLHFLTGKPFEKPLRLDPFHFSYAN